MTLQARTCYNLNIRPTDRYSADLMFKRQSLDKILSSEIKQDIASRYFGFRKLIEEDTLDLTEKIKRYSFTLDKRISFDLIRIYILLKQEEFIDSFINLANLEKKLFFDAYLTESKTIAERVFTCQEFRGFTRKGRFKKYLLYCYENLHFHTELYRKEISELEEKHEMIEEEIKHFYSGNDISAIMGFLHSISDEKPCSSCMQGGMEIGLAEGLGKKLQINAPPPIGQMMTVISPLRPLDRIRGQLKKLAGKAYARQSPEFLKMFDLKKTGCDRQESS